MLMHALKKLMQCVNFLKKSTLTALLFIYTCSSDLVVTYVCIIHAF